MKRITAAASLMIIGALCFPQDAEALLQKADAARATGNSFEFRLKIEDFSGDEKKQSAVMSGFAKGDDKTLVQYEEPASMKGKRLLMADNDFYVFLPATRRPVRMTPSQRLMGQASNGDVMSVRFQTDYSASLGGEEAVKTENGETRCAVLELNAKRKGTTYSRITLRIDAESGYPIQAECFALSGKKMKTIEYSLPREFEGKRIVSKAVLVDHVNEGNYTVIEFLDMRNADIPDAYFNKEYLVRMQARVER